MYVAVNTDLKMPAGKVGQYVGRVVAKWFLDYLATEEKDEQIANAQMNEWISDGEKIVVLGATKKEMDALPTPDIEVFGPDTGLADASLVAIAWKPTAEIICGLNKLRNLV
jgi:peptidyl-tRNA hydrolase